MAEVTGPTFGNYEAYGEVTYAIYGLIGGVWTFLGRQSVALYGYFDQGGWHTLNGSGGITVTTSATVTQFRAVAESGGSVQAANAHWTSQTTSGTRTATPNGETITATVRPN